MKFREIIGSVYIPYLKVLVGLFWVMFAAMCVADWMPSSYFFLKYVAMAIMLVIVLYVSFWIYRGGHRKLGVLYAIGAIALFAISIVVFRYAQLALYGG